MGIQELGWVPSFWEILSVDMHAWVGGAGQGGVSVWFLRCITERQAHIQACALAVKTVNKICLRSWTQNSQRLCWKAQMIILICFSLSLSSSGSWLNPVSPCKCCGCPVVLLTDRKAILVFRFPVCASSLPLCLGCPWPMACFILTIVESCRHHFKTIAWTLPLSEAAFSSPQNCRASGRECCGWPFCLLVFHPYYRFGWASLRGSYLQWFLYPSSFFCLPPRSPSQMSGL